jgi:hypothetical protein
MDDLSTSHGSKSPSADASTVVNATATVSADVKGFGLRNDYGFGGIYGMGLRCKRKQKKAAYVMGDERRLPSDRFDRSPEEGMLFTEQGIQ